MKDQVKDVEDKGKAELERYFHLSQKKKSESREFFVIPHMTPTWYRHCTLHGSPGNARTMPLVIV